MTIRLVSSKKEISSVGLNNKVFIPTMGNLHAGHLSLVRFAKRFGDNVIVSIFVNPKQFGKNEDFNSYPRTLEEDIEKLKSLNMNLIVYAPKVSEIYPVEPSLNFDIPSLTNCLCGLSRLGHFNGVLQVILRLVNQIKPSVMIFGKKDYQQYLVIQQFCRELDLKIDVVGVDTVREENGLAMSSRNNYFDAEDRGKLGVIFSNLNQIKTKEIDIETAKANLLNFGFQKIDYLEIRNSLDLTPCDIDNKPARLFFAGFYKNVRLIDNIEI